jgi:hypothetical protein
LFLTEVRKGVETRGGPKARRTNAMPPRTHDGVTQDSGEFETRSEWATEPGHVAVRRAMAASSGVQRWSGRPVGCRGSADHGGHVDEFLPVGHRIKTFQQPRSAVDNESRKAPLQLPRGKPTTHDHKVQRKGTLEKRGEALFSWRASVAVPGDLHVMANGISDPPAEEGVGFSEGGIGANHNTMQMPKPVKPRLLQRCRPWRPAP